MAGKAVDAGKEVLADAADATKSVGKAVASGTEKVVGTDLNKDGKVG
jgi:hypothetical protein